MVLDELFERAVMLTKLVWRKHGDEISRREVKRLVTRDAHPAYIEAENDDAG